MPVCLNCNLLLQSWSCKKVSMINLRQGQGPKVKAALSNYILRLVTLLAPKIRTSRELAGKKR